MSRLGFKILQGCWSNAFKYKDLKLRKERRLSWRARSLYNLCLITHNQLIALNNTRECCCLTPYSLGGCRVASYGSPLCNFSPFEALPVCNIYSPLIADPPSLNRRLASSKADLSGIPVTPFKLEIFSGWLQGKVHVTYTTNISPRS